MDYREVLEDALRNGSLSQKRYDQIVKCLIGSEERLLREINCVGGLEELEEIGGNDSRMNEIIRSLREFAGMINISYGAKMIGMMYFFEGLSANEIRRRTGYRNISRPISKFVMGLIKRRESLREFLYD